MRNCNPYRCIVFQYSIIAFINDSIAGYIVRIIAAYEGWKCILNRKLIGSIQYIIPDNISAIYTIYAAAQVRHAAKGLPCCGSKVIAAVGCQRLCDAAPGGNAIAMPDHNIVCACQSAARK